MKLGEYAYSKECYLNMVDLSFCENGYELLEPLSVQWEWSTNRIISSVGGWIKV